MMNKPTPTVNIPPPPVAAYDYHDSMAYLEEKYKFDSRDFSQCHGHFGKWADAKGYKGKDPEGKDRNSSQIWYAEYMADPNGDATCPPYEDFWHWMIDNYEISNGEEFTFLIKQHIEEEDEHPEFVETILKYWQQEFGDEIEIRTEW